MTTVYPLILAGGAGSRLWPLSRELYPKQLLPLINETTMLQDTVMRLRAIPGLSEPIIVCNQEHRFMIAEQLQQIGEANASILLEPYARNTAPAVAVGALEAQRLAGESGHAVVMVLPADHVIGDEAAFVDVAQRAIAAANDGHLATFGVLPTHAETGYGYIQTGEAIPGHATGNVVRRFVEKPDADTAQGYLEEGGYRWNSGMFVFRADAYLDELARHNPAMHTACQHSFRDARRDLDFIRLEESAFESCPSDSIDYAVMERTDRAVSFTLDAGWSDVGSWDAVWQQGEADESGNVSIGDVLSESTTNCYLRADDRRLLATVGVDDLIIVDTADAVLVAKKDRVQDVKAIVSRLKADGRGETALHREVFRPWGSYEGIDEGTRFQVKRITVKPGEKLSLQMHHHRAEHWIVVSGTAKVTRGEDVFLMSENEGTYIPLGETHRLENPGKLDLEMIEVQSGSYLGEDDIVRFEDTYGR